MWRNHKVCACARGLLPAAAAALLVMLPALAARDAGAQSNPSIVITCLGDSVTHSYPYGEGDYLEDPAKTYAGRLATLLEEHDPYYAISFEVRNNGINGETAGGLRNKLDPQHPNFAGLLDDNPDFVLLMIGGNDIAGAMQQWDLIDEVIEETVLEVKDCIEHIKAHTNPDSSHPTLILSTFIPNRLEEGILGSLGTIGMGWYNDALIDAWSDQDLFAPLLEADDILIETNWNLWTAPQPGIREPYNLGSRARPQLMHDSVHPNEGGYANMAGNWFAALGTFPSLTDSDEDGLSDALEDSDGDGVWDQGAETNFADADTDGDGCGDFIETTCDGVSAALDPGSLPSAIKVNFQPYRTITPGGHLIDGGRGFTQEKGFGW